MQQLPQSSRLFCKLEPSNRYTFSDMLMSRIEYFAHLIVWRETKDAKHGNNQPTPIEPWVKKKKKAPVGQQAMDIDAAKALLAMPRK